MIPRMVHYCWFGRGIKDSRTLRCINSWKKILPNYEFKEWNENNFNINLYTYAKEALDNRKYAFVTDVVRLYALYTEGGIYMDTDVELLKSFDPFLHHVMFSGFETDGNVPTGMMGAEKGSIWAKELLDQYHGRHFVLKDGTFDLTTNTTVITQYMLKKGLILNNSLQDFPGLCTMYPSEYFCPKDHTTGIIKCTDKTVCIHHFSGSWVNKTYMSIFRHNLKVFGIKILGQRVGCFLADAFSGRLNAKR